MFLVFFYVSLCFFLHSIFLIWFVFYVFFVFFLPSLAMCFLCFMCFLFFFFKLLSRPFSPLCFCDVFCSSRSSIFFSSSKVSFLLHLFYVLMPFFVFFPVYFLPTLFFVNFILVFSFSFHWQSCCFDFSTLSSFCPQNFALSYLVVVSLFCRILFSYVIVQLFLIATRGIFTSFRIQPNQIVEISPSFLFLLLPEAH